MTWLDPSSHEVGDLEGSKSWAVMFPAFGFFEENIGLDGSSQASLAMAILPDGDPAMEPDFGILPSDLDDYLILPESASTEQKSTTAGSKTGYNGVTRNTAERALVHPVIVPSRSPVSTVTCIPGRLYR
jgi:hypothetical protein